MSFATKLEAGEFAVLAEMEPPKGVDVSKFVADALRVKGAVDAFVVPEMTNAVMRMSSLGASMVLEAKGLPTVMQVNCRDRNRLALQADLLAAFACGIANIMAVTGEDPSFGDHHHAKAVYDVNLLELLEAVRSLCRGKDMAGVELMGTPIFFVGSTANASATGKAMDLELEELEKKIAAGASFFITPPVFDPSSIELFRTRAEPMGAKIVPTVLLLKSVGMARYIDKHVDHVHIPASTIDRIVKAPRKVQECVRIAAESIKAVKDAGFSGVMLSTLGWEHKLADILEHRPPEAGYGGAQGESENGWGKHKAG